MSDLGHSEKGDSTTSRDTYPISTTVAATATAIQPLPNNYNGPNGRGGGRGDGRGGGGRGGGRGGWTGYQQPGEGWAGNQRQGAQADPNAHLGPRPPNVKCTHGHDCDHTGQACQMRHANHVPTTVSNDIMGSNPKNSERTILPSQGGRIGATVTPFIPRTQPWAANAMVQPVTQQPMQPMQQMQPVQQLWGQ